MAIAKKHINKQTTAQNWKKLKRAQRDEDEIPTLDQSFWDNAIIGSPLKKRLISLRLDNDMIEWFKNQGINYQTRMNQVLRSYMEWNGRNELKR